MGFTEPHYRSKDRTLVGRGNHSRAKDKFAADSPEWGDLWDMRGPTRTSGRKEDGLTGRDRMLQ